MVELMSEMMTEQLKSFLKSPLELNRDTKGVASDLMQYWGSHIGMVSEIEHEGPENQFVSVLGHRHAPLCTPGVIQ